MCSHLVFVDLPEDILIGKILQALHEADCWLEARPCSPDSVGDERVQQVSLYIRAVGRHHSSDLWVATESRL